MYSQWIPQNLQKRLLLYILQQLSLFSEIDLPNLEEVSLNTIHLKDVLIDSDKVGKLRGCNVRYGKLRNVELSGGMVGGVNFEIDGAEFVVALNLDSLETHQKDVLTLLAQSTADLASTIMFENKGEPDFANELKSDLESSNEGKSPSSGNPKKSAFSGMMSRAVEIALLRLQVTVKNISVKFVSEAADLVLYVKEFQFHSNNGCRHVSVKGISLAVARPNINPGHRNDAKETTKDKTGSEKYTEDDHETSDDHSTSKDLSGTRSDTDEDEKSDSNAYDDGSLSNSMVFSHEEASSIYMSAVSQSMKNDKLRPSEPIISSNETILLYVDDIHVKFDGLNPASNLSLDIQSVRIAAVPLMPTASLIFNTISKMLKLKNHNLKKQNRANRRAHSPHPSFPQYEVTSDEVPTENDEEENFTDLMFNKLHVSEIIICLTSAISSTGEIASCSDDINIMFQNLNIKQKNKDLIYGGVEKFRILNYSGGKESVLFEFDSLEISSSRTDSDKVPHSSPPPNGPRSKADIRFEIIQKFTNSQHSQETTALLSKNAIIKVDCDSLQYLTNFFTSLKTVYESVVSMMADLSLMRSLNEGKKVGTENQKLTSNLLLLQTSSITSTVILLSSKLIKIVVLPILYNKADDQLSIQRVMVSLVSGGVETPFFSIPSVALKTTIQGFKSFYLKKTNSIPHCSNLQSSNTLSCGEIQGTIDFKTLLSFYQGITSFVKQFSAAIKCKVNALPELLADSPSQSPKAFSTAGLASSIYSKHSRFGRFKAKNRDHFHFGEQRSISSFRFMVQLLKLSVTLLFSRFGDLHIALDHFEFNLQEDSINGFVNDLSIERRFENQSKQPFFHQLLKTTESPIVLFSHKTSDKSTSTDIILRKFCLEYYTQWLQLIEKNVTQGHNAEEIVHLAPHDNNLQSGSKGTDFRVTLIDFCVGLTPSRLHSKLCLGISRGNMDFTIGKEQFYIKSSFREPSINLIDNCKLLKEHKDLTHDESFSPHDMILKLGFLSIGHINTLHLGITVNSDIEKIKERHKRLGIRGDLSLVDLKLNTDDISIGLAADSCHTLLQTINDLKTPIFFKNDEKFRTTVSSEFEMPDDILSQIDAVQKNEGLKLFQHADMASLSPIFNMHQQETGSNLVIVDEYYGETGSIVSEVERGIEGLSLESSHSNGGDSSLPMVEDHYAENKKNDAVKVFPFSLHVNLSEIKIYLYDGYDWKHTRKALRKAIQDLEQKAQEMAKKSKNLPKKNNSEKVETSSLGCHGPSKANNNKVTFDDRLAYDDESAEEGNLSIDENLSDSGDEHQVAGTFFESIHLVMSEGDDPSDFVNMINSQVQSDMRNDTSDHKTQHGTNDMINVNVKKYYKSLRLNRSGFHKGLIELKNFEIMVTNFTSRDPRLDPTPYDSEPELVNCVDIRVGNVNVFDNVPTSTWNKLLTYMSAVGEREIGTDMFRLSLTNVRPDPKLVFAEAIILFKLLPIRLYIDQDTLSFLTRFFEFKDTRFALPVEEPIYIQKLVVDTIRLKFDYKPKKVDYAGIRSGYHAELANFFILDGADICLEKTTLYGILGFPKLGEALKNVYGPYIQKYQLANILLGLSPLRSLVNLGGGVKDLVVVPYKEYKKDKRLVRSLQKGTKSFAKTTTYELLKLGVKLASGTQVILENLEEYFGGEGRAARKSVSKSSTKSKKEPSSVSRGGPSNNLLETSQLLKRSVKIEKDPFSTPKFYTSASLDEAEENELDSEDIEQSLLVFNSVAGGFTGEKELETEKYESGNANNDDSGEEYEYEYEFDDHEPSEKTVSLYSNQPSNAKEGLVSAYKSLGRNFKSTKRTLVLLKKELQAAESFQDLLASIAKLSPVIVIRPVIGTTEAVIKTLTGISNQVDSTYMKESQDKYPTNDSK